MSDVDDGPPGRGRLKMADIARIAGVDISTISRALADSPRVTDETKQRIRQVVEETGYVVNRSARTLRAQRTGIILVMLPSIASSSFADVVLGIEEVVQEHGYNVIIGNTQYDPEREQRLGRQLLTGAVDGLILITGRLPAIVTEMADYDRRIVAVSRRLTDKSIPSVSIDNRAAARDMADYLVGLGHRRIAHLSGPLESPVFSARLESYREAMSAAALEDEIITSTAPSYDVAGGRGAMQALLTQGHRPTAVMCASDEMAIGAMQAARAAGIVVPADMAFTGFDDITLSEAYEPPLTTIRIPRHELGRVGAQMLLQSLDPRKARPRHNTLDYELVIRRSTDMASRPSP